MADPTPSTSRQRSPIHLVEDTVLGDDLFHSIDADLRDAQQHEQLTTQATPYQETMSSNTGATIAAPMDASIDALQRDQTAQLAGSENHVDATQDAMYDVLWMVPLKHEHQWQPRPRTQRCHVMNCLIHQTTHVDPVPRRIGRSHTGRAS